MFCQNPKDKLNDLNGLYNSKLDARIRRQSDELNKSSSITRLTNEAKSSISEREKKQDKILLSPITTSVNKPSFELFGNSDSENGEQTVTQYFKIKSSTLVKIYLRVKIYLF